jgi:imidazolonepropionase-like amidohydrolase
MTQIAFTNARVFDGHSAELHADWTVLVDGARIVGAGAAVWTPPDARSVDCGGRTLLPGLIDAHVHVYAQDVNLIRNETQPITLLAQRANVMLRNTLMRGFTTVRDCGGADYGLALALQQGWLLGPRLYWCGPMLSQTGGHGDLRHPHERSVLSAHAAWQCLGGCGLIAQAVDGETEIARAVREQMRRGASFIKFAASGGVTSIAGSVNALQFSDREVRTIVEEVERHERYCTAHCHPDAGIARAIELGVHGIEHASMISPQTARLAAERGTHIVPTLAVATAIERYGVELGYPAESMKKVGPVKAALHAGLVALRDAGAVVGFGTDLLGPLEAHQRLEFRERAAVYTPLEILRQATSVNARILREEGRLGCIAAGAWADLIVIDGDPLADIGVLADATEAPFIVMKDGVLITANGAAPATAEQRDMARAQRS